MQIIYVSFSIKHFQKLYTEKKEARNFTWLKEGGIRGNPWAIPLLINCRLQFEGSIKLQLPAPFKTDVKWEDGNYACSRARTHTHIIYQFLEKRKKKECKTKQLRAKKLLLFTSVLHNGREASPCKATLRSSLLSIGGNVCFPLAATKIVIWISSCPQKKSLGENN